MNIHRERHGGALLLRPEGRMDGVRSAEVERALAEVADAGYSGIVFDMSAIGYVSSAGLRVILMAVKQAKSKQQRILFAGPSPQVREVLEMSGFLSLLEVRDSAAAAMEELQ
ncbi:STAS domain-containing protein [Paenibacillus sp. IB182496]|uniref:Anti-sigma factor antagonist n=1 Tax=Paenibacillus sabuli TaxID=2772509 RepID=A0A927BV62_9BACL|nr:STAS domain-containing protein [Paenibacillus sabuli]MBD2846094.1 STAS domain-containing protein [Paenibacillus sabuli]